MESLREMFLECVPCLSPPPGKKASVAHQKAYENARYGYVNEKAMLYPNNNIQRTAEDVAGQVFSIFQDTANPGRDLESTKQNIVHQTSSWKERFAKAILSTVQKALIDGNIVLKGAMGEAYEKATRAAEGIAGFAHDHPVWTAVIALVIALGILHLLMPVVLEILGFGLDGPIEGSFAASWESLYGGFVPKGSLFSYLQRLGMKCRWEVVEKTLVSVDSSLL